MLMPTAIIVSWVGPSDRPTGPIILGAGRPALAGATDWMTKSHRAQMGVTAVEIGPDEIACVARAIPPQASAEPLVEVTCWDGASSPSPVALDGAGSTAFLTAATECLGSASPAAGYFRSIQTLVNNATR